MSIRAKFLGFVDVIMRIPPLFLLDEILKMSLFDSTSQQINNLVAVASEQLNETIINNSTASNLTEVASVSLDFYGLSLTLFKCLVFLIGKCLTRRLREGKKICVKYFCKSFLSSSSAPPARSSIYGERKQKQRQFSAAVGVAIAKLRFRAEINWN